MVDGLDTLYFKDRVSDSTWTTSRCAKQAVDPNKQLCWWLDLDSAQLQKSPWGVRTYSVLIRNIIYTAALLPFIVKGV
jgi:hypothetical protein